MICNIIYIGRFIIFKKNIWKKTTNIAQNYYAKWNLRMFLEKYQMLVHIASTYSEVIEW